jgi:hypothetical protein
MDVHGRPYKCRHKGCAKLLGFTYPGGLSSHEKEVHSVGREGVTDKYKCPAPGCLKTCSRKENINEHVRRVHKGGVSKETAFDNEESTEFPTGSERKRRRRADRLADPELVSCSVWTCILMVILRFLC